MSQVIIFTGSDGIVNVCYPSGNFPIEQVQANDIPAGVQSYIVDLSSLPVANDDFYEAWEQSEGVITINIEKAKEVTKKRLRFERAPLFAAQDLAFQRALEVGGDTAAIVAEKQRLRDLPLLADFCTTLDELRALHA